MNTVHKKIIGAWAFSLLFAVAIVKLTSIGPVILTISRKYGMGVHSFDLIVFIPLVAAFIYTVISLKKTK